MSKVTTWLQRRREERQRRAERSGDTPERTAERTRPEPETSVEDAAKRASVGLTGNGAPFQG